MIILQAKSFWSYVKCNKFDWSHYYVIILRVYIICTNYLLLSFQRINILSLIMRWYTVSSFLHSYFVEKLFYFILFYMQTQTFSARNPPVRKDLKNVIRYNVMSMHKVNIKFNHVLTIHRDTILLTMKVLIIKSITMKWAIRYSSMFTWRYLATFFPLHISLGYFMDLKIICDLQHQIRDVLFIYYLISI